ncbi:hypothetical protein [Idiomarina sp.]|uniref:hypothetical protein n=1 Tax=Idiomarina sp. TaxID=1874361 RepID=UPI0025BDB778|nr:hypothetical protein [Idiomarina sp.]NQZ03506.1 hypothetical protein [Idiomarina sp.]
MVKHPLLFDLLCEWNRWVGQRGKVAVLVLGFSVLSAVFAIVLHMGDRLFLSNPAWVGSSNSFYTVSAVYKDGRQAGVNLQSLMSLQKRPFIDQVGWLRMKQFDFRSPGYSLHHPQALIFDQQLVKMLALELPNYAPGTRGVWITERYWQAAFNGEPGIVGQYLNHDRIPAGVPIRGILPSKFNRIGPWQPDVWLSEDYPRYVTPFTTQSPVMIDRFLRSIPEYYGIFSANRSINLERLTAEFAAADHSVEGMRFAAHGGRTQMFEGVVLDQQTRQRLKQLWLFSVVLVVCLAGIFAFNALMSFANRNLVLADEYRLLQTLGARGWDLVRPVWVATAVQLLVIALCSLGLMWLLNRVLNVWLADATLVSGFDMTQLLHYWLASFIIVSLVYGLAIMLPLLNLKRLNLFSRVMGTNRSRGQLIVGQLSLVFQFAIAMVAILAVIQLFKQQLAMFDDLSFTPDVEEVRVQSHGGQLPIQGLAQGHALAQRSDAVAVSIAAFDDPRSITFGEQDIGFDAVFELHYVSPNYFDVLGVSSSVVANEWQSGVVINQAAALMLKQHGFTVANGAMLHLGGILGAKPIAGIADNIEHKGRFAGVQPTLYLPELGTSEGADQYSLFINPQHADFEAADLSAFLAKHLVDANQTSQQKLSTVVQHHEAKAQLVFYFSLGVVVIMLSGISLTLNYQVRARLQLEQSEYGLLLAIGAPMRALLARAMKPTLLAFIAAMMLVALLSSVFSGFSLVPHVSLVSLSSVVALMAVALIAASATWLPVFKLSRQQIRELLQV